jgi:hypothetical protein
VTLRSFSRGQAPADGAAVTSLTLRAVPNKFSLIRPILGWAPYDWKSNQRLFHWCRMPCAEMKDLEAIHSRYGERRRTARVSDSKKKGPSGEGPICLGSLVVGELVNFAVDCYANGYFRRRPGAAMR